MGMEGREMELENTIIMRGGREGKTQPTEDKQTKPNDITSL